MGVVEKRGHLPHQLAANAVGRKKGRQISAGKTFTSFNECALQITNLTLTGYCRQT